MTFKMNVYLICQLLYKIHELKNTIHKKKK